MSADPQLVSSAAAARELEKARRLEEGYTEPEVPEDEEPTVDETTASQITAEQWTNAQTLIQKFSRENLELRGLLRRYQAAYGDLED